MISNQRAIKRCGFAIVVVGSLCMFMGAGEDPARRILKYEVDPDTAQPETPANMDRLTKLIDKRLGGDGHAKAIDDRHIEIAVVVEPTDARLQFIRQRLTKGSYLELRITADPRQHKDKYIVDLAKQLKPDEKQVKIDDHVVAEWVAYSTDAFGAANQEDMRIVKRLAGDVPEALVIMDPMNITGEYLESVLMGLDEQGNPEIHFAFNDAGAKRISLLTTQNLPNAATGAERFLGVIVDKRLLTAPGIHSAIDKYAKLSGGNLKKSEMEAIAERLSTGVQPYTIREVKEPRDAK